jgi:threonine aldolase
LRDDLSLNLACHSNDMAAKLYNALVESKAVRLFRTPQTNEIFFIAKKPLVSHLDLKGVSFLSGRLRQRLSSTMMNPSVVL